MRYKSENGFFKLRFAKCFAGLLLAIASPSFAQTTDEVTAFLEPKAPYTRDTGTGNVYLASVPGGSTTYFIDTDLGYRSWDVTATSSTDTARANILLFDFRVERTVPVSAGERLVLTVETEMEKGNPTHSLVPLAQSGDFDCSSGPCLFGYLRHDADPNVTLPSTTLFKSVLVSSTPGTTRIGFFMGDICEQLGSASVLPQGCIDGNATVAESPTAAHPTVFSLTVKLRRLANGATTIGATTENLVETFKLVVNVQADGPSISCANKSQGNFYVPGDREILLNTGELGASKNTGTAPLKSILVQGEMGAAPDTSLPPSEASGNDISTHVEYGGARTVSGFLNASDSVANEYDIAFNVMDAAGVLPAPVAACTLSGVQTSEIQGFLGGKECFIATASFQSDSHWVVEEFRHFRDEWLAFSRVGRELIAFYYERSPAVAAWVDDRFWARIPALGILIPIEALMALVLHPKLFVLPMTGLFLMGFFVRRSGRSRKEARR